MCGITGYKVFDSVDRHLEKSLIEAMKKLGHRGPDSKGNYIQNKIGLGHTRLSIIDTSDLGNQPMSDSSGRYTLIFNGEIYNYKELKKELFGITLKSACDTEVLLHLLIKHGTEGLEKLNGFFALAFYDKKEDELLIARDRMGIKPLHFYRDQNQLIFGSEMKALLEFPIPRTLNREALHWYLKLNYLPGHLSMLEGVQKLEPGHFILVRGQELTIEAFWKMEKPDKSQMDYESAKSDLVQLMDKSVKSRLMTDVPLGAFLSGGTDSSAVVSLASRHHQNIDTFSIGYRDHSYFDETQYAELVAKKFNTNHHTFSLTNDDLLSDLDSVLDYIDEPFADSSAIPTYILSKHVSKHVKVALSGDGADELFGGYYKHLALERSLKPSILNHLLRSLNPIISNLPQSRSGKWTNIFRRLDRFGRMINNSPSERYWMLASLTNDSGHLLKEQIDQGNSDKFKKKYLSSNPNLSDYLDADLQIVLPGDMLTKVDLMSMANSLEVRVPFLDKDVVQFARSLPDNFKIKGSMRKRIVQDAFRKILPEELYNRPKKGFEVPLLYWMRNELLTDLDHTVFNSQYLEEQGVFNTQNVMHLRSILISKNPRDVHATVWALFVFQKWFKRYISGAIS